MSRHQGLTFWGTGSRLSRRGNPDRVSGFQTFTPGDVKPLGKYDTAEGARNVGPRLTTVPLLPGDVYNGRTYAGGDVDLYAGESLVGREIFGRVKLWGQAYLGDSIVHGQTVGVSAQDAAIVGWDGTKLSYNLYGSTIDHVRIEITSNKGFTNGIDGGNYLFTHGENYGGVDAFGFNAAVGKARVWASRMCRAYYTSWRNALAGSNRTTTYTDAGGVVWNPPFPGQGSGDTHSDCIQLTQGNGYEAIGNNMGGTRAIPYVQFWDPTVLGDYNKIVAIRGSTEFTFACFQISSISGSPPVGLLAEKNWVQGGQATINVADKSYDHMTGVIIRNNIFYRPRLESTGAQYGYQQFIQNPALAVGTTSTVSGPGTNQVTLSGNVWADDGTAVPLRWYN